MPWRPQCSVSKSQAPDATPEERQRCAEVAQWKVWTALETSSGLFTAECTVCDQHAAYFEITRQVRLRKPLAQI